MNYATIMLKNAIRMKASAKTLADEILRIALTSYDTVNWREGTMGQVEAISNLSAEIDECNSFYNAVKQALLSIPKKYAVLLVKVYFKRADKELLATKYGVSRSTVYRKLFAAREMFGKTLNLLGFTEDWFYEHYAHYDFITNEPYHKRKK